MYVTYEGSDLVTDVIVVGTGPGGLSSVGSAVASGAEIVAIEAHSTIGGNGVLSTGWVSFVDTEMQPEQGIQDSVQLFMEDCKKLVDGSALTYGLTWDEKLTKVYAEKSAEVYDVLKKRGVKFNRLIKRPLQTSVDRLHAVTDTRMFPEAFQDDFAGPHVKTFVDCRAHRLLLKHGVVTGVQVQPNNGNPRFTVLARKGIILATGGYQASPSLRRHFQPDKPIMGIYPGLPHCRGDGHLLGQAIGGDLINMTMIPPIIAVPSQVTESAIAVNLSGQRFHDEAGPYLDRVKALEQQENQQAFHIFDDKTRKNKSFYVNQMPGPGVSAETLRELADKININSESLTLSVEKWNAFLASSQAKEESTSRVQFEDDRRGILESPYHSYPMIPGISLTVGGFVTTQTMQVVDIFGEAIPGLFAVGDCAGGITPTAEMGGTHLGGGFVMGWVAGKAAATGEQSVSHMGATFGKTIERPQPTSMPIIDVAAAETTANA